ncbi:MAG: hypothetical protein V3S29_07830 [bacterium]
MPKFDNGDLFPHLEGETVAHGRLRLPEDIPAGQWAIVLVYRAEW